MYHQCSIRAKIRLAANLFIVAVACLAAPATITTENTRESIAQAVGKMSLQFPLCKSNIMMAIYETESSTMHEYRGEKFGSNVGQLVISSNGAVGVGQILPYVGKAWGFNIYTLSGNIQASYAILNDNVTYYIYTAGYDGKTAMRYAIQAYYAGRRGRLMYQFEARRYMWKVLNIAEGQTIPLKYR